MKDLISRQAVLDELRFQYDRDTITDPEDGTDWILYDEAVRNIEKLPSAQEKRTDKRTEMHTCDCISRRAAIEALEKIDCSDGVGISSLKCDAVDDAVTAIKVLPSAQPEIIRCRECKYAEVADKEDSQDGYTCQFHRGSIWFSGSYCSWAERREVGE